MLYHIKEHGKYAEITGFKNVKFSDAERLLKANRNRPCENLELQFFDADVIATQKHLYFAVLNALQAFQNNTNISKSLAVETMLYVSAQRQIKKAIEHCGVKPQTRDVAVIVVGVNSTDIQNLLREIGVCFGSEPDEGVLKLNEAKIKKITNIFSVKDEEIGSVVEGHDLKDAVVNLVVERVALLATQL